MARCISFHNAFAHDKEQTSHSDVVHNESVVRLAGYLFDQPNAGRGVAYAALRNSGAAAILLPYRVRRAGSTAEAVAAAQEAVGTTGNLVVNVEVSGGELVITFADGTTRSDALPAGMGGSGVDQTARDAAASNSAKLMPPSPDEAGNGTSTAIRGWTAALIATLVDSRVAGGLLHVVTTDLNIAMDYSPSANPGDIVLEVQSAALKVYRRLTTNSNPYFELLATYSVTGSASISAGDLIGLMNLVTSLPSIGDATWGEWYGLADIDGQVEDVHYLRQQNTTEQTWIPARLDSTNRDLHGFNDLDVLGTYGYERGGALSPEAEVVQLVEEKDANGNITTRLLIPAGSPLTSEISVILLYKSGSQGYVSAREVPLFRDATVTGTTHRYVTAVTTGDFRFTPGVPYTIKWRNAGAVHDLVLHSDKRLARVADEYDVLNAKGSLQQEIYTVEDRVATLEAAPAGGVAVSRYAIAMPAASYIHRTGGSAQYFGSGESIGTVAYPSGTTLASMTAAFKTAVLQKDFQASGIEVGPPATEALATELWGTHAAGGSFDEYRIIFGASNITLAVPSTATLPSNEQDGWLLRLSVVS